MPYWPTVQSRRDNSRHWFLTRRAVHTFRARATRASYGIAREAVGKRQQG